MVQKIPSRSSKKNLIKEYNYNIYKIIFLLFVSICLSSGAYAWFYHEYISRGTRLTMGNITALVKKYDSHGILLDTVDDTSTLIYEPNLGNTTKNSVYVEITNDGTLDMEYYMTFQLDGTSSEAGTLYYRVYEVTSDVRNATITDVYDTKLKAYAAANPVPMNMETDQALPISNLTTISTYLENSTIELDKTNEENNSRYYRIDYGMYSSVNTALYNDSVVSVHLNVYATQIGSNLEDQSEGEIWLVENEEQFRTAVNNALSGDTIRLNGDVEIPGSVDLQRRIHLDTNEYSLNITGDLVWDYTEIGELDIDVTGEGKIDIGGELYINAPKSNVVITGENNGYDIFVASTITMNGLQNDEEDGILLDNVRIIKNKTGNIPGDIILKSNTRINVGPNVYIGNLIAEEGSTNIEVINNGSIVQLQLEDMDLLPTFTKAQIYVYNLNVIQGIVGGSAIVLPDDSTPYLGSNRGNTLIVNSPYATEVTVSGSTHFTSSDISSSTSQADVVPIDGEPNAYIVYIRAANATLESLLHTYFEDMEHETTTEANTSIASITKLIIYTSNAQYLENVDFDYMKSGNMSSLAYLDLSSAKVIDNTTVNKIPANAMQGKTTLKTLILPNTVSEIGDYAFDGVPLGTISSSYAFSFLNIPSSVTKIGDYAFSSAKYVEFDGYIPPEIKDNTFTFTKSGVRLFVSESLVKTYQDASKYDEKYIHIAGVLSDNKAYIIHFHGNNAGVSLFISTTNVGTSLTIANNIVYSNTQYPVICIGDNAFSHITTPTDGTNIILPNDISEINSYAFYNIKVNDINIENTTEVGDYAFYNANLTEAVINDATYVGDYAFYGNSNLVYATMDNLVTLGDYAFANTDLYEVNLGTVKEIGNKVFDNVGYLQSMYLNNLETITYYNREIIALNSQTTLFNPDWIDNTDNRVRIYVPEGETESHKTYLSLYRQMFTDYEDYVYVTGEMKGSYNHAAIHYDYGEYMVRPVTYITSLGTSIGAEIIDYHGADLTSSYQIPESFEIDGVELPVVSIGENAYRHVNTTGAVDIVNNTIISVGDYSFYDLAISSIDASELTYIGDYAFGGTGLEYANFPNLYSLGDYALSNMDTLYSVNLGSVTVIGSNSVSNNPNLAQIFITNTEIDNMDIANDAFDDIGTNINSRLRVYVPEGSAYTEYYKTVFRNYEEYIYPTGTIVGTYPYLPYDIGAYAIREVTLENRAGQSVTGWEIIDYHGEDLNNTYNVPTSFTVGDITNDVISIGERSYIHVTSSNTRANIINNKLINIENKAFDGVKGINSLSSTSLVTLDDYAFNNSSLTEVNIPNIYSIGEYALANMTTLYKIDIGKVAEMKANSIANAPNLSQTFFTPHTDTLLFNKNAFTNVGNNTNNRIRFYVSTTEEERSGVWYETVMVEEEQEVIEYNDQNVTINISGTTPTRTQSGSGTNRRYTYTYTISINNNTQNTIKSWSTEFNYGSTTTTNISYGTCNGANATTPSGNKITFSNLNGTTIPANGRVTFTFTMVTTNSSTWTNYTRATFTNPEAVASVPTSRYETVEVPTEVSHPFTYTTQISYTETYASSFKNEYHDFFFDFGEIIGSYSQNNIPYDIGNYSVLETSYTDELGGTFVGYEFVEYHGPNLTSDFIFPSKVNNINVIMIGNNAFKFAEMSSSSNSFTISSNNLVYIGNNAFDSLNGVNKLELPNVEYIGSYAFRDNIITEAHLDSLLHLGDYALSNNRLLNYIDLGPVNYIGESALYNCTNLEQIFIRNTSGNTGSSSMNITIGDNSFYNTGTAIGSRLRVYVPDGNVSSSLTYVNAYKNTLPSNLTSYIYATGYLVGSFVYNSELPYNIQQYSVRQTTLSKINGSNTTGWEIIEYHGDDINNSFQLPNSLTIRTENGTITQDIISVSSYSFSNVNFSDDYTLELPDNLLNIGDYAYFQRRIAKISGVNTNLTNIGKYAFAEMPNLSSVEFSAVKNIDDYAFYNDPILATTILGTNTTYIGERAFYYEYTTARRELYIDNINPPDTGNTPFPDRKSERFILSTYYQSSFHIYVPSSAVSTYSNTSPYSDYASVGLYGGTSNIHSYTMTGGFVYNVINNNQAEIQSYKSDAGGTVAIPTTLDGYTVTAIKAEAFDTVSNTTAITIPATVNRIENGFLSSNGSITTINVDAANTTFSSQDGVLYDKNKTILIKYPTQKTTENFTIPNTVVMIATEAFANNTSLRTITIPASVAVISHDAFKGVNGLTTVTFNGNVPYVTGYDLFDASPNRRILVPNANYNNYTNNLYLNEYTFTRN